MGHFLTEALFPVIIIETGNSDQSEVTDQFLYAFNSDPKNQSAGNYILTKMVQATRYVPGDGDPRDDRYPAAIAPLGYLRYHAPPDEVQTHHIPEIHANHRRVVLTNDPVGVRDDAGLPWSILPNGTREALLGYAYNTKNKTFLLSLGQVSGNRMIHLGGSMYHMDTISKKYVSRYTAVAAHMFCAGMSYSATGASTHTFADNSEGALGSLQVALKQKLLPVMHDMFAFAANPEAHAA
jgi:hypothetical protein